TPRPSQTAMDASTINGVVRRLMQRGLLAKSPAPDDQRLHLVALTAEGERVLARAIPMAQDITRMTLAPLGPAEQAALVRLLRRIG
ncbi:MAG TPA: MarR family winged helix-turn-helix transcriptional regulator, partial [Novosphingobium sp.]|nr:MarR family winged helix-turn-helix transcriptional regulator [Novosphingobium sp.]